MNSPAVVERPISNYPFSSFQNPKISKPYLSSSYRLPSNFIRNPNKCLKNCSLSPVNFSRTEFRLNILSHQLLRVRALSNDAQSITSGEVRDPSFVEFITSERVKVVAMLALALALCNADRVVMSVAIVPLSTSYGWRQSFAGVVQSIVFFGPGIALIGLIMARSPLIASAWLTLAVGLKSFSNCGFLVNLQEIAPQYSGVLHGLSNTAGTSAAILGTVGAGYFVELVGSFKGFLLLTALLYFSAALFWNIFSTGERVNFDEPN